MLRSTTISAYTIIHAVLRQSIQRWPISGSCNYTACCRAYDVIVKLSSETRAITVAIALEPTPGVRHIL